MSSILALSVSDKIDQYGAYAGFASVLGLAILSLLYFAQAREVKRLREWAGRAPERAADVQDRAVAAAQQRVIAQPQRPAQPQPGQPVRPGAPGAVPAAATPAGQAAGAAAPAAAAATAAGAATATPPGQQTSVQPAAAAAANGAAQSPPTARPGEPLRVPPPPPGTTRTNYGPDDRDDDDEGRSRLAVGGAIAAVVVVLIVIVVLVTGVFGGSDDNGAQSAKTLPTQTTPRGSRSRTTPRNQTPPAAAPKPGTYEVSVLNGTTVPGLARGVANRLQNTRFKIGTVTNAATQDRSATLVEFAPGHRAEGDAVAKAIDVNSDSIQALTPGSKTIAGESAVVVVTVGSDQNQTPAAPTGTTTTP
jgi:hypothetical protein